MGRRPGASGIEALSERYGLSERASEQLECLLGVLVSDRSAPTAIQDHQKALDDHLADALVALELDLARDARNLADLGSGAGIPGLPLAIARPSASVWLVESSARKCRFLDRAAQTCELGNVEVIESRIEAWAGGLSRCELVTARALDSLTVVAEYAAPLLVIGGALVAWRGKRDERAERASDRALAMLGLELREVRRVQPYEGAHDRHLHVISKVRNTPDRFPRRVGMARKRPLDTMLEPNPAPALGESDRPQR